MFYNHRSACSKYVCLLLLLPVMHSAFCQPLLSSNAINAKQFDPATLMWYTSPAVKWEDALPVGNGRLGAMVFGKNKDERIQFNEDSYWTGGPYSSVVKNGHEALPEIQRDVFEGKFMQAHNLFGRKLMGYPVEQQKYQSLANLFLFFKGQDQVDNYKRWLDLNNGVCSTEYQSGGITYRRDVFASHPDQVIVIRITASKKGSISLRAELQGVRNQAHSNYATDYFRMDGLGNDGLILRGKSADYLGVAGKLRFEARVKAVVSGGSLKTQDADLFIDQADTVTLYFTAATNFVNYKDVSGDEHARMESYSDRIAHKSYQDVFSNSVADYRELFNRVSLHLQNNANASLPTNERLANAGTSPDPSLAALCYQFARAVMIDASRPGTEPANLQGIWNQDMNPAWDAKYTTNINQQMNYWPVETANLAECAEPLTRMVNELTDQGEQVAREHYGCRGWVFHQNTDLWRVAAPMDGPTWGTFTTGGAWLTTQLWEHYLYSTDTNYLKDIYPVMRGSILFFLDFLVAYPHTNWLVTNPSTSPENFPARPGNGPYYDEVSGITLPGTTICAGSSIDMEILNDLFGYYIQAAQIMHLDSALVKQVSATRLRLRPPLVGKDSLLQEWTEDWGQLEKQHRHLSPLYGLYPGNIFSLKKTPEFIPAIKHSLEERGDDGPGFSITWKMALWARLGDGNRAHSLFLNYLKTQCFPSLFAKGGTQFQVDGVFGAAAGITEMLVQSHENTISLLPALPDEWREGELSGIRLRGGFELTMTWKNNLLADASLLSRSGQRCHIAAGNNLVVTCRNKTVKTKKNKDGSIEFATVGGMVYTIKNS